MIVALNEDWLRFGLGLLVAGGTSAITSLAVNDTQIGAIEKRQIADMAQIREIFEQRDRVDRVTLDSTNERVKTLQESVNRLQQRMDLKFGSIDRDGFIYAALLIPDLPDPDPPPKIFDEELKYMRGRLDELIHLLKAGKLDTDDKRDDLYSLELDYEILKGWQIWCETSPERRYRCQRNFKKNEE